MKRIIRILALTLALVTGLMSVSAQTVQVVLFPNSALPSTALSYLDDPLSRYFNIQFIVTGAGSDGLDIFFDMNMTVNTNPRLYVRTRPDVLPMQSIHVHEGVNLMSADALNTQVLMRTETSYDYSNLLDAQQWTSTDGLTRTILHENPSPLGLVLRLSFAIRDPHPNWSLPCQVHN